MNSTLDDLLIHPKTMLSLENFIKKPSHALLILGDSGSGKRTVALAIASKMLDISPSGLDSYPYFIQLKRLASEKEISVESVRQLIKDLQLKTLGTKNIRRVVFIEDAGTMSTEAQNSILKILEEPSLDTVFIATTTTSDNVLSTISSRAQKITIHPVSLNDAQNFYAPNIDREKISRAWQLSRGNAGLLNALLSDSEQHPLKEAVITAKSLIKQSPYYRLLTLDGISKDKAQLILLLDALNRVITSLHHSTIRNGNTPNQKLLLHCRRLIKQLQSDLAANANPRLAMMHLAMNLSV